MSKTIVGIFAHADDESLSCGGILARHALEGDEIHVAVLADGVGSRFDEQDFAQIAARNRRSLHFHSACDALGIPKTNRHELHLFPDQQSDIMPQLRINKAVEQLLAKHKPDRVYTHFAGDINLDHRRVSEAVQVATRGVCEVWCVEPEWPSRWVGRPFDSSVRYVMPQMVLNTKLLACACYQDELRDPPHPRSLLEIKKRALKGEAFEVIR